LERRTDAATFTAARAWPIFLLNRGDLYPHDVMALAEFAKQRARKLGFARICSGRAYHQHSIELDHVAPCGD
jgi:hypothetical protein